MTTRNNTTHTVYVNPGGYGPTNTSNRAEMSAVHMALRDLATHREDLVIMTDSLCTLQLINKMRRCPHLLKTAKHRELLESIIELIERRMVSGLSTGLCKVKSHIGIHLNELVDKAAKQMAEGPYQKG